MTRTCIEFFDITTHDGWTAWATFEDAVPMLCVAEGYIVSEDDNVIRISPLRTVDKTQYGYVIIIPKGCIFTRKDYA